MNRSRGCDDVARETVVVFHVAGRQVFTLVVAFKLSKQFARSFTKCIDEHIETSAVRHTDDHFFQALSGTRFYDLVHGDNEAFSAFEREAFLTDIFSMEITLQTLCSRQFFKNAFL